MEKKKLLLVAVSVGVFLVIVISAAILIFNPRGVPAAAGNNPPSRSATADPGNMLQDPELRNLQIPSSVSPIQENNISIYTDSETKPDRIEPGTTVINIAKPSTAAVPDVPGFPNTAEKPAAVKPAAAQPARQTSTPAQQTSAPVRQTSAPPKAPIPAGQTRNNFWVQAGSYSTRDRADNVKKNLDGKGITAIITNQEIDGRTYYRVRLGPYTSKNEAEYWLVAVKSIDGFEGSQVWESRAIR
jgi:DedD protein